MLRTLPSPPEDWGRPWGLAVAPGGGALFVSDERMGTLQRVAVAPPGSVEEGEDAEAREVAAGLKCPQGLCEAGGRLFVCEAGRSRVCSLDLAEGRRPKLQPVWDSLKIPSGITVAPAGDSPAVLYVACAGNHVILARDLRCQDDVRIIAGVPGQSGNMKKDPASGSWDPCGDGGPAAEARLFSPCGLAVAASGELLIADSYNGRVRSVDRGGFIQTIAGADQTAPAGSHGPATEINIGQTRCIAFPADNCGPFVSASPGMVWQLRKGEMFPIVGTCNDGFNFDSGDALEVRLNVPCGLACFEDRLAIADSSNRRVRLFELI